MEVFCGIDWAEDHHGIALVDTGGQLLARRRINDDAAGLVALLELLTAHGDSAHYDRRRADGDRRAAAQRNLFGRLLGCLHHCLATGQHYRENTAFPAPHQRHKPEQLDNLTASDVFIASQAG